MIKLLLTLSLFISTSLFASEFDKCSHLFYSPLSNLPTATQQLCNEEYAVLYSYKSKTPLFSYFSPKSKSDVSRSGSFKPDPRIPTEYQSFNRDFAYTNYDRGHLTPAIAMTTKKSMSESFLLSNVAPQEYHNNQRAWKGLESLVDKVGYKYIITGVLFQGEMIKYTGNYVLVPTQFYKIVSTGKCSKAYISDNSETGIVKEIEVAEIYRLSGIDFKLPTPKCE